MSAQYNSTAPTLPDKARTPLQTDSTGSLKAVGNVASGATDSGNPVKIGGVYNSAFPTLTNGQRGDVQMTAKGFAINKVVFGGTNGLADSIANTSGVTVTDGGSTLDGFLLTGGMYYDPVGGTWNRQRGDTTGAHVVAKGTGTIATGQVSVTNAATLIAAARSGRGRITITTTAATVLYVGKSDVSTITGLYIEAAAGASLTLDTSAAVYGIVASGTLTVSYLEEY